MDQWVGWVSRGTGWTGGHVGLGLSRQGTGGTETAGAEGLRDQGCLLGRDPGRTRCGQGCQMAREQSQAVGRGMKGRGHKPGRWGYRGRQPDDGSRSGRWTGWMVIRGSRELEGRGGGAGDLQCWSELMLMVQRVSRQRCPLPPVALIPQSAETQPAEPPGLEEQALVWQPFLPCPTWLSRADPNLACESGPPYQDMVMKGVEWLG